MLELDGSLGEGGGQMVRTALALSALTGLPFHMERIRAGRPRPGLKAQHLQAIKALQAICGAQVSPVATGTAELTFEPSPVQAGQYFFDIGTAGSISLLLQALIPPLLFAPGPTTLRLRGGTCGKWQPPVEYTQHVMLPYLQDFATIRLSIERRGYFPKGGGAVTVKIEPHFASWKEAASLPPYAISVAPMPGRISGIAFASDSLAERRVAERMAEAARKELKDGGGQVQISTDYDPAYNPGAGIVLWAKGHQSRLGADALGERGKPAETVGREAAQRLNRALASGAPVDEHMADQLIPYLALRPGSRMCFPSPTGHLESNIEMTEQFLPVRFESAGNAVQVQLIRV